MFFLFVSSLLTWSVRYYLFFLVLTVLLVSCLALCILSLFVWFQFCIHCSLSCFLIPNHLNILSQTMIYTGSNCNDQDCLAEMCMFCNTFPSPIVVHIIIQDLQSCKPVLGFGPDTASFSLQRKSLHEKLLYCLFAC